MKLGDVVWVVVDNKGNVLPMARGRLAAVNRETAERYCQHTSRRPMALRLTEDPGPQEPQEAQPAPAPGQPYDPEGK